MTDRTFDVILGRLDQPAGPDPAFADRLFDQIATEAGLRGRTKATAGAVARRLTVLSPVARQLAWAAVLAALLVLAAGLLVAGPGRQTPPIPTAPARVEQPSGPPPTLHLGSGRLSIGSPAPAWTGTLLDGGAFSTADLLGKPAALLMWCSCVAGPQARLFADAAAARGDEIGFAIVSVDLEGTTRGLVEQIGADIPVVDDQRMRLLDAWALDGFPALILLRADGRVADVQQVTFSEAKLRELLDALASGEPIPDPETRTPTPTDATGQLPLSTILEVGDPAPELSGPLLGGGERSTRDLLGRPAIVHFWLPPRRDGTTLDDMPQPNALLDQVRDRSADVTLLLVASAEAEPGDAQRYLDRQAWNGDVLLDWSGELGERWGLVFGQSTVVLDAEGRVVLVAGPEAMSDPATLMEAVDAARAPVSSGLP
jgi:hypothetical protein